MYYIYFKALLILLVYTNLIKLAIIKIIRDDNFQIIRKDNSL